MQMSRGRSLYALLGQDVTLPSNSDGSSRQHVMTPVELYDKGLDLAERVAGLRADSFSTNAGVTTKLQFSLDGQNWSDAASPIIAEKTSADDYVGDNSNPKELLPYVRLVVTVRDKVGSNQVTVRVSLWCLYKYRV